METVEEVFAAFGGIPQMARATGLKDKHLRTMKARKSIPVDHWPTIIEAAERSGIENLSSETLMRISARKREAVA